MAYHRGRHYRVAQKSAQNEPFPTLRISGDQRRTLLAGVVCLFLLLVMKDAVLIWIAKRKD